MNPIKIFSWNILGPETKDVAWYADRYPAIIHWHDRFMRIMQTILHSNPDIICLQEVSEAQKHIFELTLFAHGFVLGAYASKGPRGGVILFYKKERFTLNNLGHVHINPHQTFHHNSACVWVTLIDKQNNKSILITSAHLQPQYIQEQFRELIDALAPLSRSIPILIIGDFNTKYKSMINDIMPYLYKLNISDHIMKLFLHESWTHQSAMKHGGNGGWSSLDHAVYTNNLQIDMQHSFVGNATNSYKTDLASLEDHTLLDPSMEPIPNAHNPSDHVPLLITIFFSFN